MTRGIPCRLLGLVLVFGLAVAGCGKSQDGKPADPPTGGPPAANCPRGGGAGGVARRRGTRDREEGVRGQQLRPLPQTQRDRRGGHGRDVRAARSPWRSRHGRATGHGRPGLDEDRGGGGSHEGLAGRAHPRPENPPPAVVDAAVRPGQDQRRRPGCVGRVPRQHEVTGGSRRTASQLTVQMSSALKRSAVVPLPFLAICAFVSASSSSS